MWKLSKRQLALAIVGGLVAAITILTKPNFARQQSSLPTTSPVASTADFLGAPIVSSQQLIIDELEIRAAIIPLGLDEQGNFADPNNPMEVGWYVGGPAPGSGDATASVLLDGHLTGPSGQPAIFANLHTLEVGDKIKIELAPGKILTYEITKLHNLETTTIDLADYLTPTTPGKESLTIVTCAGDYNEDMATYTQRLIVQAVLTTTPLSKNKLISLGQKIVQN